ncbi:MAG TPA: rhodanese-like domain-containing protein [Clostridia bacterium]|nr:rhodanese-like domain-containing protein [Clostridia bacterium]
MRRIIILVLVISILIFGGCAKKDENIVFHGTINDATENSIMVDNIDFNMFDKASVAITDKTKVEGSIEVGKTAEITILPLIRESYPVQVTATKIVIKDEMAMETKYRKLTPEQAKEIIDGDEKVIILDVRTGGEYSQGHIEGAILIPDSELEMKASKELPNKDDKILLYCRSGSRSKASAKKLISMGYTNVYDFGGIIDWNYEIVK